MAPTIASGVSSLADLPGRLMPGVLAAVGDRLGYDLALPYAIGLYSFPEDRDNNCGPVVTRFNDRPVCLPGDPVHHTVVLEPLTVATLVHLGDPARNIPNEQLVRLMQAAAHSLVMRRGVTSDLFGVQQAGLYFEGEVRGPVAAKLVQLPLAADSLHPRVTPPAVKMLVAVAAEDQLAAQLLSELVGAHVPHWLYRSGTLDHTPTPTLSEVLGRNA